MGKLVMPLGQGAAETIQALGLFWVGREISDFERVGFDIVQLLLGFPPFILSHLINIHTSLHNASPLSFFTAST